MAWLESSIFFKRKYVIYLPEFDHGSAKQRRQAMKHVILLIWKSVVKVVLMLPIVKTCILIIIFLSKRCRVAPLGIALTVQVSILYQARVPLPSPLKMEHLKRWIESSMVDRDHAKSLIKTRFKSYKPTLKTILKPCQKPHKKQYLVLIIF